MRITFSFIALLLLLFSVPALAADPLAAKLQKKYASINTMQSAFTQVLVHKESGSRQNRSGTFSFKKPLLVRWDTQSPSKELLLVSANVVWNAFPDEEIAYKYALSLAQDSRSIIRVMTGQARLDQDFVVENEGKEGNLLLLRLYPKDPTQALVEALLWIDADTLLIKKVRVYDFYGNENEIAFDKQNINGNLNDALFSYTPPKDYAVEDMTKKGAAKPKNPLMQ